MGSSPHLLATATGALVHGYVPQTIFNNQNRKSIVIYSLGPPCEVLPRGWNLVAKSDPM